MDPTPLLRSIELFEGLTDQDLAELGANLQRRQFVAGSMVFSQGDNGDSMYIVESGDINIHLPGDASRRISLKDIARGTCKKYIAARWRVNRAAIDDAVVERRDLGDDDDSALGRQCEIEHATGIDCPPLVESVGANCDGGGGRWQPTGGARS